MPVNFNAMIQPQIGTALIEGDAARQNALLKNQQMANAQQEMAMREKKFGQEEAEYQYLVKERDRVNASMAQLNKYIQDNGGVPGPDGYRMMIDTRNPQMVQMGLTGLQMLDDDRKITEFLNRTRPNSTPSQSMQPAQSMQSRPGGQDRVSLLPQPENFSPRPQLPQSNALAPSMDAGAAPTNALTPRSARSGYTQDDLIELASMRDPRAQNIVRLLSDSKSLGAEYLQLSDRYKLLDPKSPEAIDIRKRMDYMTSIEGKQQPRDTILPSPGPGQPAIAIRVLPNGTITTVPLSSVKPEPPKSETDKRYEAHVQTEEAVGRVPLPRDQWANEQVRSQAEAKANVAVQKKLDIEYPKAKASTNYFETSVDKEIKLIDDLIANKTGLKQITGGFSGNIEASYPYGSSGRKALATINTLRASGILSGLTELKNNGGTLGSVSNAENVTLGTSRTTATNRTQDADQVIAALQQYKSDLQTSKTKLRDSFNETYSYRNNKPSIDPKMPGWGQ